METEIPAETIMLDEAENQSFFGFQIETRPRFRSVAGHAKQRWATSKRGQERDEFRSNLDPNRLSGRSCGLR